MSVLCVLSVVTAVHARVNPAPGYCSSSLKCVVWTRRTSKLTPHPNPNPNPSAGVEVHPLELWTDCCTNQTLHAVPHPERVEDLLDYSVY